MRYRQQIGASLPFVFYSFFFSKPPFGKAPSSVSHLFCWQYRFKMSKATSLSQPPWKVPSPSPSSLPQLKLYNSLTRKKEIFTPIHGRKVTWYNCGPTVYDAAHIGHARLYLSIDVMRRILQEYFNYDVHLVMNITDIDDKIILRARQSHLYEDFLCQWNCELSSAVYDRIFAYWKQHTNQIFGESVTADSWPSFYNSEFKKMTADPVTDAKKQMNLKLANAAYEALMKYKGNSSKEAFQAVTSANQHIISVCLDLELGAQVTDHAIFRDLAAYWEHEFMNDMVALGVRPPDVLTRVSEYVPEIRHFVQRIIDRGFAYEADGSVYFDTAKFHSAPGHAYAKLEPWSATSERLIREGEGDLSTQLTQQKRAAADFALWKRSKDGEPSWSSPWGPGRPGWHIECSVMASAVLGEQLDIHTGGIDLAFPHHDNELAQSEACFECEQWVNYFLHVGHLHVEGQKMSKSLKNFTSIREALEKYPASSLRMLVLQQHWQGVMDFKASTMQQVQATEHTFLQFATTAKAILEKESKTPPAFTGEHCFHEEEKGLMEALSDTQSQVHAALCDNLNTPVVIEKLLELISKTHIYLRSRTHPNTDVLRSIAQYVTRMTKIFGLTAMGPVIGYGHPTSQSDEASLMPYLQVIAKFRDQIRDRALVSKDKSILQLCDALRDEVLPALNVVLDDSEQGALVKLVDSNYIKSMRETMNKQAQAKAEHARQVQLKKLEKLYASSVSPSEMFKTPEFSSWDEKGLPLLDHEGQPLSKSRLKKLTKDFEAQSKLYETYLAEKDNVDWTLLKEHFKGQGKPFSPP